jgi:hypothetical protein
VAFAAVTSIAVMLARLTLDAPEGLRAEYFDTPAPSRTPLMTRIDARISPSQMRRDWGGAVAVPEVFSARWSGYLTIDETRKYTLGVESDDGSTLTIDGQLIVDNGGTHHATQKSTTVLLNRGTHAVAIAYNQAGGDYALSLLWGRDGAGLSRIPDWRLSPVRVAAWKLPFVRLLDVLSAIATAIAVAGAAWILIALIRNGTLVRASMRHPAAASLVFFIALTIAETWPLATNPARLSRNDNDDTMLNEWAIAWVAHQAPRAPLHLYDANAFYPERHTLAYSEAMIPQAAMAAPLLWAGASPVTAYNLVLLAGFVLNGWAMSLVVRRWTGSWAAGLTSGVIFSFNAHVLTRLPHLQAQHVEFLPLALLALDDLFRSPGRRNAVRLGVWFALQALTSLYMLVFSALAMIAAAAVRANEWIGHRFRAVVPWFGAGVLTASVILTPFMLPYWWLHQVQGFSRPLDEVAVFNATWDDYLSTPGTIHYNLWSNRWMSSPALFPGVLALLLAGLAIARGTAFKDPRARTALAFGIAGVALSFGTKLPGYATLYEVIPLLPGIRAVSRFGYLGIVAAAILAGFGVVELRRWVPARLWTMTAAGLIAVAAIEIFCAPIWYARFDGIPRIYQSVRNQPEAVVVEMPFSPSPRSRQAAYMLNSTEHWRPLLNGYTGFYTRSFDETMGALEKFPDEESLKTLRERGVTDVFVHLDLYPPDVMRRLDQVSGMHRLGVERDVAHYALDAPGRPASIANAARVRTGEPGRLTYSITR